MYDLDSTEKYTIQGHIKKFLLYPPFWRDELNSVTVPLKWESIQFDEVNIKAIDMELDKKGLDKPGLYAFVIAPNISNFIPLFYCCYIGKTNRELYIRLNEYVRDQKGLGKPRPKVFELLKEYKDNLLFFYAPIDLGKDIVSECEDKLINTLVPYVNTDIPKAKIKPELKNIYEK